jgi:dTDP-D-glucose 4,6-dehydratase
VKLAFEKGAVGGEYAIGASNEQKNISLVDKICGILDDIAPPVEVPQLRERGLKSYTELIQFTVTQSIQPGSRASWAGRRKSGLKRV